MDKGLQNKWRGAFVAYLRRNLMRKIFAVFLAVLIWNKAASHLGESRSVENVLVVLIPPGDSVIMDYEPKMVKVEVKGFKKILDSMTSSDIEIKIPVSEKMLSDKRYNIPIEPAMVKIPQGMARVVKVSPDIVKFTAERELTRHGVKVTHKFIGEMAEDYERREVEIIPPTVSVTGPESAVLQITTVKAEPIEVDKTIVSTFTAERKIIQPQPKVTVSPAIVKAQVEIGQKTGSKSLDAIPVNVLGGERRNVDIGKVSQTVRVSLKGLRSSLERTGRNDIKAFVDISKLTKPGLHAVDVVCWVSDSQNVKVINIEPASIEVKVSEPAK